LESICGFPPRFVVTYQRNIPNIPLSSKITIFTGETQMEFKVNDGSEPIQGNVTIGELGDVTVIIWDNDGESG